MSCRPTSINVLLRADGMVFSRTYVCGCENAMIRDATQANHHLIHTYAMRIV